VIFICDAVSGEPGKAILVGRSDLTREAGERAEAFTARAMESASMVLRLPSNGR
jgi:hypothetical protein